MVPNLWSDAIIARPAGNRAQKSDFNFTFLTRRNRKLLLFISAYRLIFNKLREMIASYIPKLSR
jgi:hypothetical protein